MDLVRFIYRFCGGNVNLFSLWYLVPGLKSCSQEINEGVLNLMHCFPTASDYRVDGTKYTHLGYCA